MPRSRSSRSSRTSRRRSPKRRSSRSPKRRSPRRSPTRQSPRRRRSPKRSPTRRTYKGIDTRLYGMQQDLDPRNCDYYDCVEEDGVVKCYAKNDLRQPPEREVLFTFTVGDVRDMVSASPTTVAFDNVKRIASNIVIEHAKIYINNKPGLVRTFGIEYSDGVVTFSTKSRRNLDTERGSPQRSKKRSEPPRPIFALKSDYIVVDNTVLDHNAPHEDGRQFFGLEPLLLDSTKKTIRQGILVEESALQNQMLFGTSGSGKTKKTAEIISAFVAGDSEAQLVSVRVIYGQADMTDEYLRFRHLEPDGYNITITDRMREAFAKKNFDGDGKKKTVGVIPLVQMTLQFMSDPSLEPLKRNPEFPIHFVTQTVNNPVSSRCLTAYKIQRSDGRVLIIFDAPGNENAADIIRGMFQVNDPSLTDDKLVRLILDNSLDVAPSKTKRGGELTGTLPIFGDNAQLSYYGLDSDEVASMRSKATDLLSDTKQRFTNFKADPAAFIPGIADRSETPKTRVNHLKYCQMRVRESLYINLLIGEMTRTLDMSKAQGSLNQVSPFVTVKSKPDKDLTFATPIRYCVDSEECTISSVRAIYVDDTSASQSPVSLSVNDMDTKHKEYRTSNNTPDNILNKVLPIRQFQEGATEIRAIVVVPIGCDTEDQQSIIQNGVWKLSEQLIGRFIT